MNKKLKRLETGEILWDGIIYPGETAMYDKVTFDASKWFKFWREKASEIKKSKLNYKELNKIHDSYMGEVLTYGATKQIILRHQEFHELSSELQIAFQIASSNYREPRGIFWGFLTGLFARKISELPWFNQINNHR